MRSSGGGPRRRRARESAAVIISLVTMACANAQWVQQGSKLVAPDNLGAANQGYSVALSQDGNTLAVGGPGNNANVGAVWIFVRNGSTWNEQQKVSGSDISGTPYQGISVALSGDGNTLLFGGYFDNGGKGAAWVFVRNGTTWTQQGSKLVASNAIAHAFQGFSVALSTDGNTALVGAPGQQVVGVTIGAGFVFTRTGTTWTQQATLQGTGSTGAAQEGSSVALNSDATTAALGGYVDHTFVGATWVFTRSGSTWTQQGNKLVGNDASGEAEQGVSVALSSDGNTLAVGGNMDASSTGAVWIYTRSGATWSQQGSKLIGTGAVGAAQQGTSVALSSDGNTLAEGGYADNSQTGAVWKFVRASGAWSQQGTKYVGTGGVGSTNPTVGPWQGLSVALSSNASTMAEGGPNDSTGNGATWIFVTPAQPATPLGFFPITPCRIVDTRQGQNKTGQFGPPSMTSGSTRPFDLIQGGCGLPASAEAFSLNFTVIPQGGLPFLTVWPTGQTQPNVSTLNAPDGSTLANAAIVPSGTNNSISVFAGGGNTDLIIDTNGYFGAPTGNFLEFYPLTPCRIADTRQGQNKPAPFGPPSLTTNSTRDFPLEMSACNIPAQAEAYSLNFTAVPQGQLPYLSVWPTGQPYPNVSTLNSNDGSTLANAAIVPVGTPNGSIRVLSGGNTDLIIDVNGYFAAPTVNGLHFYAVTPCRIADTRGGFSGAFGPPSMAANSQRNFPIQLSNCNIPSNAQVYSLNVTAVPQGSLPYLSIWPAGQPYPNVSTLNSPKGTTIANAAIVPAGSPNGGITVLAGGKTDVIIDINGYFAP